MKTACIRITRFGPPEVLEAGEVEVAAPGVGEALVRQTGIGVNFVDVYHRIGQLHGDGPKPPFIPGVQANGVVESIGPGVSNLAVGDLVGGQVPLLFSSMATAIPFVQSGKIRALAVTSDKRASALPDVPTIAEQGFPGFEASVWFALVGPAKLPAEIVAKVNAAMNAALAEKGVQEAIRKQGYEPLPGTPTDLSRSIRSDYEKWGRLIRDRKISFE
jgi:hypothetical protein